ncbi:MAG: class I SAM-dependent methyltransferase [Candidatus Micrarchaeales archaeon]|nr:class I SAM-dependent methyltransferase [Candidatus Micrarchaeales archaeon]
MKPKNTQTWEWKGYYEYMHNRARKSMPKIASLFEKKRAVRILDFCCGSGGNAIYLAKKGFEVYGFDLSKDGIKIAKDGSKGLKTHFKVWSMERRLPYRSAFFDAIIIYRALYHARIATIRKAAKEVERVTKPGGLIYMESDQGPPVIFDRISKRVGVRTYLVDRGKDGFVYYHYFNKKELLSLFKNCKIRRFYFKGKKYALLAEKLNDKNV